MNKQFPAFGLTLEEAMDEGGALDLSPLTDTQGAIVSNEDVLIIGLAGTQSHGGIDFFTDIGMTPHPTAIDARVHRGFWLASIRC